MDDILDMLNSMPEVDQPESELVIAEQKFQENVRADIDWLMEHKNVSRKELADLLGITAPAVSKMLNKPNMTLKSIARIFKALGEDCIINSPTLEFLRVSAKLQKNPSRLAMTTKSFGHTASCEVYQIDAARRERQSRWRPKAANETVRDTEVGAMIVNGWQN
ncbi:MAG: helix-turn-helix domain-containing protein [Thalassospira sp.]|nr:helix-turn-helix domain-containing protein [Thalassospira sp.]